MKINVYDGLEYACATGKLKEWSREKLVLSALYITNEIQTEYLKIKDIGLLPKPDVIDDNYIIYNFGYQFRIPQTKIQLFVSKKDNRIFIKRDGLGYGWEEVEKVLYRFVKEQIKKKNIYLQTNLNDYEFIVK